MIATLFTAIVLSYLVIGWIVWLGKQERQDLEDRLMSVSQPLALVTHKALRDEESGDVTYVDEAREAELSPSWSASE